MALKADHFPAILALLLIPGNCLATSFVVSDATFEGRFYTLGGHIGGSISTLSGAQSGPAEISFDDVTQSSDITIPFHTQFQGASPPSAFYLQDATLHLHQDGTSDGSAPFSHWDPLRNFFLFYGSGFFTFADGTGWPIVIDTAAVGFIDARPGLLFADFEHWQDDGYGDATFRGTVTPTPEPASLVLLLSGALLRRYRHPE